MKSGLYFVLYVAVVLEILIIILDRDEAEEGLKKTIAELREYLMKKPSVGTDSLITNWQVRAKDFEVESEQQTHRFSLNATLIDEGDQIVLPTIDSVLYKKIDASRFGDAQLKNSLDDTAGYVDVTKTCRPRIKIISTGWQPSGLDPRTKKILLEWGVKAIGLYKVRVLVVTDRMKYLPPDSALIAGHAFTLSDVRRTWDELKALDSTRATLYFNVARAEGGTHEAVQKKGEAKP